MAKEIVKMHLAELSLVPRPANKDSMISLFKRDHGKGTEMTEKTEKSEKSVEDLNTEVETLKNENERLRKSLLDNDFVIKADIIEKKAPVEYVDFEGEQIAKSDIPEPILKALETADLEKAQREVEKADEALAKRASEELPHFDEKVAKGLLSAVAKMDDTEILMEALVAADKAFEEKMEELGEASKDGDLAKSSDKMDELVKNFMTENKMAKSEYSKAYSEVVKTENGRKLATGTYKD